MSGSSNELDLSIDEALVVHCVRGERRAGAFVMINEFGQRRALKEQIAKAWMQMFASHPIVQTHELFSFVHEVVGEL